MSTSVADPAFQMQVVVGRIGRPQGIRGEVTVEVRTDSPEVRFAVGATLLTRRPDDLDQPAGPGSVVVDSVRWQGQRMILSLVGTTDRNAAETLRGLLLVVEVDPTELPADEDEFYDHQLLGLDVQALDGAPIGAVTDVLHLPSQDVLVVRPADSDADEVLVPFVEAIVHEIDLDARVVRIDPPAGLLDEEPG